MTVHDYDLFVIGAGSGGVRAARIAAGYGARVAIAEEFRVGGTCVIRGCVPKKLLVYAARFAGEFEDAAGFGWTVPEPRFDWPTLIANKDKEIARLEGLYRRNLERARVEIIEARAELAGPQQVRLTPVPGQAGAAAAASRVVSARVVLVATGARPFVPTFPGSGHAITSNEALDLPRLPKSIVIVGGGYIAVEFASIFNGLGSEVTLVYRGDKVLRGFDEDLRDGLMEEMGKRGVRILTRSDVRAIMPADGAGAGYRAELADGSALAVDEVMYATGRLPNTAGLNLGEAGVGLGEAGEILVDELSQSSLPWLYAVGDVTDRVNLTPVAIREGHAFADTVFGGKRVAVSHDCIPTAVFSEPEIGTVGFPEHEARARFPQLDVYKARFRPMKHTLSGRDERMLMKLLVDGASGRVVGCHILGPDAAEMVQLAAIAIRMGATKADFDATMALHPSAAEELVTMREKWVPPT